MRFLLWMSLGCFFLCVCHATVLCGDIDGVPDPLLMGHMKRVNLFYCLPALGLTCGVLFLCASYILHLGMVNGCAYLYFGIAVGPCFLICVGIPAWYLKRARSQMDSQLGKALFVPWADTLEWHSQMNLGVQRPAIFSNNKIVPCSGPESAGAD